MEKKTIEIKPKKVNEIAVETSRGTLIAKAQHDQDFPGILLYLGEELYARLEVYEEDKELRLIAYNDVEEEPTILQTLKVF